MRMSSRRSVYGLVMLCAIERAADNGDVYSAVETEYDPDLGYPKRVNLQCHPNILDCGLSYELRNLEPLDAGS